MSHELLATGDAQCLHQEPSWGRWSTFLIFILFFSFGHGPSNKITNVCMCLCFPPGSSLEKPFCFSDNLYKKAEEQGRVTFLSCVVFFTSSGKQKQECMVRLLQTGQEGTKFTGGSEKNRSVPKAHVSQGPTRGGVKLQIWAAVWVPGTPHWASGRQRSSAAIAGWGQNVGVLWVVCNEIESLKHMEVRAYFLWDQEVGLQGKSLILSAYLKPTWPLVALN